MPFYRLRLRTRLSPADVIKRVASSTQGKPAFGESLLSAFDFGSAAENEYFIGETQGDRFSIHRNIRYRNSFLPCIKGRVTAEFPGSLIELSMHLHPFVALFMVIWLGAAVYSAFSIAVESGNASNAAGSAGMFSFGLLLAAVGFFPEAIKARNKLKSLLEADTAEGARRPTVSR